MALLAVTAFGNLIGLPSALLCLGLIFYLLVAPPPRPEKRARIAISRFFVFVSLAFAAIWFWMNLTLPLGAWMFVLGDNNSWFYDYSPHMAAGLALIVSCVAFLRGMASSVSSAYIRCLAWVPPVLLVAAGMVYVEEMLSRMAGASAETAAQNIMKGFHKARDSMHLEEHSGPPLFPDQPKEHRTFWVVENQEKIGLIMVWKNGIFGWKLLRSHWFGDSTDILIEAKVHIEVGDKEKARYCLEQVIRNLPGTPAEREAYGLLATLDRPKR